ncbi:Reticulocalbin-2 [Toxocara canis]|uniref:Reticulocalbin-3 n=1 Tax=Toxocara canis TaxID=6265 RepID=A0A0B2UU91_TOXCA|nr:Reticulocalbin-2 [Toxocara canis]
MGGAFWLTVTLLVGVTAADREHEAHGATSAKFRIDHEAKGQHDTHADHRAVLGSKKSADEFDDLPAEESKRRLAIIARRMDTDGDGFIDSNELTDWIHKSMISLDKEETAERFAEMDVDRDGFVTWQEYLTEAFGDGEAPVEEMDTDDRRLMDEDRRYFLAADDDHDNRLSAKEFDAFQNPEHYPHMHKTLVEMTMLEKDRNFDGRVDLKEFMGDIGDNIESEWYTVEKSRFEDEYDADKNGFLEGDEINKWLIPNLNETARQEAEHLISSADKDGDGRLTVDEIVAEHAVFVGSEATNFGERLTDMTHEEL